MSVLLQIGSALHEIGHKLGFYHEQSRFDRDNHIYLDDAAIAQQGWEYQNRVGTNEGRGVSYDVGSDMSYMSVSKNTEPTRIR